MNFLNREGMRMPETNVNLGPNIKQITKKKKKFSNKNKIQLETVTYRVKGVLF